MSIIAVCPGTYDPPHRGHMETWETAAEMFGAERVCVLVATNPGKRSRFTAEERGVMVIELLREASLACQVHVLAPNALTVDAAGTMHAEFLVRGVRGPRDFEDEQALADINRRLRPQADMKTILLPCGEGLHTLSSTLIRQIATIRPDGWREMVIEMAGKPVVDAFERTAI